MARIPVDRYFMNLAVEAAKRSTCPRKQVGAVITKGKYLLVSGYNGSMIEQPHCDDVGCLLEGDHCKRVIHAEQNAIIQAALRGVAIYGGIIYCTAMPCWDCFKAIVNARLSKIIFREEYGGWHTIRDKVDGPYMHIEVYQLGDDGVLTQKFFWPEDEIK